MPRHWSARGLAVALALSGCAADPSRVSAPTATPPVTVTAAPSPTASPGPSPSSTPTGRPSATPTRHAPTAPAPTTSSPRTDLAVALWHGTTSKRLVALTFDAGSDVGHTVDILDLLEERGIHASFGLTGRWVRANPLLARRIASEGHLVVNHSDTHASFTGRSTGTAPLTRAQRLHELSSAEASLRSLAGVGAAPWFRPPYGDRDASVDRDVALAGYRFELMWSVDTLGWRGVPASEVTRRVLDAARPGEIVLMHVGAASTDWVALPDVIDRLTALGYAFVRADRF